jgi:hypothetical protein
MSLVNIAVSPRVRSVRPIDRAFDAAAAVLIVSGTVLFLIARRTFGAIAEGSHRMQEGISHLSQTELVDSRSRLGALLVCAGIVLAFTAAVRHFSESRKPRPGQP